VGGRSARRQDRCPRRSAAGRRPVERRPPATTTRLQDSCKVLLTGLAWARDEREGGRPDRRSSLDSSDCQLSGMSHTSPRSPSRVSTHKQSAAEPDVLTWHRHTHCLRRHGTNYVRLTYTQGEMTSQIYFVGKRNTVHTHTHTLAQWLAAFGMNEVNARRARLVLGWVTVSGRVFHLGM